MQESEEEALEGVLNPLDERTANGEQKEVANYRPPSPRQLKFKRRVFELEQWIAGQHTFVEEEEVIAYTMRRWDMQRRQAREYLAQVVEDFKRSGVPVLGEH